MGDDQKIVVKNVNHGAAFGPLWFIGWLFTIGYLRLELVRGILAIVLWPYYLGVHFARP